MDIKSWLNKFGRSDDGRLIGGVCSGLGAATMLPAWVYRLLFIIALLYGGTGLILYLAMWVILPQHTFTLEETVRFKSGIDAGFRRVKEGNWIAGVCTGLAKATGYPAWLLRLVFVVLTLSLFAGLLLYVILWLAIPEEGAQA